MPKPTTFIPGAPIWADLASNGLERSIEFYTRVLGWQAERTGPEFNNYVNFTLKGEPIAGMVAAEPGQADAWLVYLNSSNTDATAASVTESGGTVLFDHPVADLGKMLVGVDPTGAPVAAWQPGLRAGFAYLAEVGAPAWFELHTDDFASALEFYTRVFGWTTDSMGDSDEFRMVTYGAPPVAGIYDAKAYLDGRASQWLSYFLVADADASAALIVELGGSQFDPVADTPFGRMCHVADSGGARFSIIQEPQHS